MHRFPLLLVLAACSGGTDTDTDPPTVDPDPELQIAGAWVDDFDDQHLIDATTWDASYALFHVADFDNDQRWLIAQNDADNLYFPELWSRFDWHWEGEDLWYCQTAYDAATEAAARSTPPADPADPTVSGCGGFPWSPLYPQ